MPIRRSRGPISSSGSRWVNVDREIEERAPPREPATRRSTSALAGVDENETLVVLDQERVDGQRLGPLTVEKDRQAAAP
jgi:hypothetical protein